MNKPNTKSSNTSEKAERLSGNDTLITRLISFISGRADPEKDKRRGLKQIAKALTRKRVKFYKSRGDMAEAGLARFFYELYKIFGPTQVLLSQSDSLEAFKTMFIEASISDTDLSLKEQLAEEAIREQIKKSDSKQIIENIKANLRKFQSTFDGLIVDEINNSFNIFEILLQLINFDYYFLLKKFDSHFPENDFAYKPHFDEINGTYVLEDLKNFLDVIAPIEPTASWPHMFEIYKQYRGTDLVPGEHWRRVLQLIHNIKSSQVLEMVVQLIEGDPSYKPTVKISEENIVDQYITKQKTQTDLIIQKIAQEKKTLKTDSLSKMIFGTNEISRLNNYTEAANLAVLKKSVGSFIHVVPLNYLKAFLLDYLKKDIRSIVDLLLIKGKWSTNQISQSFSEAYHQLINASTEVVTFDESLAEDGNVGRKIRGLNLKSKKDKNANTQLWQLVKQINDAAKKIIVNSAKNLIALGKTLKLAIDDYGKKDHALIINWSEIETATDQNIQELMVSIYKRIYYFLELLKLFQ